MKNEIILYRANELGEPVDVRVDEETVWLSLNQISQLYRRYKSFIYGYLRNIYKTSEYTLDAMVANNATIQMEAGREDRREVEYSNLDVLLSVGYRRNSKQGIQFSIWANKKLVIIQENGILKYDKDFSPTLLKDHSSKKNVVWAMNNYVSLGVGENSKITKSLAIHEVFNVTSKYVCNRYKPASKYTSPLQKPQRQV